MSFLYRLSKIVPVPMRSTYRVLGEKTLRFREAAQVPGGGMSLGSVVEVDRYERATWWQWRDHIWAHYVRLV